MINYQAQPWNSQSFYGPTRMNHMDDGIKAACDGVDQLSVEESSTAEKLQRNGYGLYGGSRNIWCEEWENGYYSDANGQPRASMDIVRSRNDIPIMVKPNTTYFIKAASVTVCEYDENGSFLGIASSTASGSGFIFTTRSNTKMLRFSLSRYYGNAYLNDIIINESDDKNGVYEPGIYSNIQLTHAVAKMATAEQLQLLTDCLLELSEFVYGE